MCKRVIIITSNHKYLNEWGGRVGVCLEIARTIRSGKVVSPRAAAGRWRRRCRGPPWRLGCRCWGTMGAPWTPVLSARARRTVCARAQPLSAGSLSINNSKKCITLRANFVQYDANILLISVVYCPIDVKLLISMKLGRYY